MTRKEFEAKQSELNKRIDDIMKEKAEHEKQWYLEVNRRLDWLRGKCFSARGCIFMVHGELKFKKTCTDFYFDPRRIPVIMITDAGEFRVETIMNWALIENDTKEEALKAFCDGFNEIPIEEFITRITDILKRGGGEMKLRKDCTRYSVDKHGKDYVDPEAMVLLCPECQSLNVRKHEVGEEFLGNYICQDCGC